MQENTPARAGRTKYPTLPSTGAGDLADTRRILWAALERAERLLRSRDNATALKAVHAVAQTAAAYMRVLEGSEFDARLTALETSTQNRIHELEGEARAATVSAARFRARS